MLCYAYGLIIILVVEVILKGQCIILNIHIYIIVAYMLIECQGFVFKSDTKVQKIMSQNFLLMSNGFLIYLFVMGSCFLILIYHFF